MAYFGAYLSIISLTSFAVEFPQHPRLLLLNSNHTAPVVSHRQVHRLVMVVEWYLLVLLSCVEALNWHDRRFAGELSSWNHKGKSMQLTWHWEPSGKGSY